MKIKVRVITKASRNSVEQLTDGSFRVRVTTAPVDGKANESVRKLLAEFLKIPPSSLELTAGHRSKDKIFSY